MPSIAPPHRVGVPRKVPKGVSAADVTPNAEPAEGPSAEAGAAGLTPEQVAPETPTQADVTAGVGAGAAPEHPVATDEGVLPAPSRESAQATAFGQGAPARPNRIGADASPRPQPRPRPRPGYGAPARHTATPPGGVGAAGFGPTSATPAPPHALFTPAAPAGVGAGALPRPDGSAPGPEFTVKGNAHSMLFHTPESPYFERTRAEVWFRTADEAVAAGFTEWRAHRRSS